MKSLLRYDRTVTYHHGDLRRTLLAETASAIAEDGVAKLSMRALAKRAGVSNAAPAYHFGDKSGLLTALAAEGFDRLAEAMSGVGDGGLISLATWTDGDFSFSLASSQPLAPDVWTDMLSDIIGHGG